MGLLVLTTSTQSWSQFFEVNTLIYPNGCVFLENSYLLGLWYWELFWGIESLGSDFCIGSCLCFVLFWGSWAREIDSLIWLYFRSLMNISSGLIVHVAVELCKKKKKSSCDIPNQTFIKNVSELIDFWYIRAFLSN